MNRQWIGTWTLALLLACGNAWTQEDATDDGAALLPDEASEEAKERVGANVPAEATIRLMEAGEAELPGAVTGEIALPDSIPEDAAAVEKAQRGLDIANQARMEGGQSVAEEARQRGADMADEALEGREVPGRAEDVPERPEGIPGPPDNPGPPGT